MNCGDWVESCTALVEDRNGRFQILRWAEQHLGVGTPMVIETATITSLKPVVKAPAETVSALRMRRNV